LLYHPADIVLKDHSRLLCRSCWTAALGWPAALQLGNACGRCGLAVEQARPIHVQRSGEAEFSPPCREDAVAVLKQLRTVEPKLSVETLSRVGDWLPRGSGVSPGDTSQS